MFLFYKENLIYNFFFKKTSHVPVAFNIVENHFEEIRDVEIRNLVLSKVPTKHVICTPGLKRYRAIGSRFFKLNIKMYLFSNSGNGIGKLIKLDGWLALSLHNQTSSVTTKSFEGKLSDKTLADTVESLIGLYLCEHGTLSARMFMNWLKLKVKDEIVDFNKYYDKPCPLRKTLQKGDEIESTVKLRLKEFENQLGYTFQNIFYLQQALTDPSDSTSCTLNYEPLEFIGDSILDVLVLQYFLNSNKNYSEGKVFFKISNNSFAFKLI